MTKFVFIAYSQEDVGTVRALADILELRGVRVWIDYRSLGPGAVWKEEIPRAIRSAGRFLACVSQKLLESPSYAHGEIRDAIQYTSQQLPHDSEFVIPVILDDLPASELPPELRERQALRLEGAIYSGPWMASVERLAAILGASKAAFGAGDGPDHLAMSVRYHRHVHWWLTGRVVRPRRSSELSPAVFGDAPVGEYMIPAEEGGVILAGRDDAARPHMEALLDRLYPNPKTVCARVAPVVAVLEDPGDPHSRLIGIVTPTDLPTKWKEWYVLDRPIAPDVWFEGPVVATQDQRVREAYVAMGPLLTGIPVVSDTSSRRLVGFLPHPGTREDWKPPSSELR